MEMRGVFGIRVTVLSLSVLAFSLSIFAVNSRSTLNTINARASITGQTNGSRPAPIVEPVTIYSEEKKGSDHKIARKGVLVRFPQAKATILLAHGFMCDKYDVGFLRNLFPYGQYNFLSFDFRAHGEDKVGQTCTLGKNEALDVIAAARFLRAHPDLKGKPLFVYAFSMGAVASIEAQSQDNSLFDATALSIILISD